jgi:uncharacterized protein (DUF2164 family)
MADKDYRDIKLEYKDFDAEELHKELKAQLGETFFGVSTGVIDGESVIIAHIALDARPSDVSKVHAGYVAHDITKLPPKPVRKTVEERLEEMADKIAQLEAKNSAIDAQSVKK